MASNALSVLIYMHILFCRHAIISDPVFLMYICMYWYAHILCIFDVYDVWYVMNIRSIMIHLMYSHEEKLHFFIGKVSDNISVFYKWSQEALTCKAFILAFRPAHVGKFQLKSIIFL